MRLVARFVLARLNAASYTTPHELWWSFIKTILIYSVCTWPVYEILVSILFGRYNSGKILSERCVNLLK